MTYAHGVITAADVAALAPTQVVGSLKSSNYTLALADAGTVIEMNVAGANTLTVPPNSAVPFPVGTVLEVLQLGGGQCTVTPGVGVTFRSNGAKYRTNAQFASISLRQRSIDEWVLAGDLA